MNTVIDQAKTNVKRNGIEVCRSRRTTATTDIQNKKNRGEKCKRSCFLHVGVKELVVFHQGIDEEYKEFEETKICIVTGVETEKSKEPDKSH